MPLREIAPKPAAQARGQVAQMVERSPEKAGVGGSIPSLATIISRDLTRTRRLWRDEQRRSRLGQASEIVEVVVLAKSVEIVGALRLNRGEQHDCTTIGFARKRHSTRAIVGVGLAIKGIREARKKDSRNEKLPENPAREHEDEIVANGILALGSQSVGPAPQGMHSAPVGSVGDVYRVAIPTPTPRP